MRTVLKMHYACFLLARLGIITFTLRFYWPLPSTPIWIRTRNLRFRRPMLYPIELWVQTASRKLIGNDPRFLAPTSPILAHFPNFLKPFHTHPEEIQLIVPTRTLYLRSTLRQFVPSHRRHSRRIAILLDPSLAILHLSPPTKRFFSPRKLRN
jgi:hypothetical protein